MKMQSGEIGEFNWSKNTRFVIPIRIRFINDGTLKETEDVWCMISPISYSGPFDVKQTFS